jgi:hypothetical protein
MSLLKHATPKEQYLLQIAWTDSLLCRETKLLAPSTIIHEVKKGNPEGSPPHFERLLNLERDPQVIITFPAY